MAEAQAGFRLRIAGHIAEYAPGGRREFEVTADGRDLRHVITDLGINPSLVRSAMTNGRRIGLDYIPAAGDDVVLLAPPAGG